MAAALVVAAARSCRGVVMASEFEVQAARARRRRDRTARALHVLGSDAALAVAGARADGPGDQRALELPRAIPTAAAPAAPLRRPQRPPVLLLGAAGGRGCLQPLRRMPQQRPHRARRGPRPGAHPDRPRRAARGPCGLGSWRAADELRRASTVEASSGSTVRSCRICLAARGTASAAARRCAAFDALVSRAREHAPPPEPGYRAGYLAHVEKGLRPDLTAIIAEHFEPEPPDRYRESLELGHVLSDWIAGPLDRTPAAAQDTIPVDVHRPAPAEPGAARRIRARSDPPPHPRPGATAGRAGGRAADPSLGHAARRQRAPLPRGVPGNEPGLIAGRIRGPLRRRIRGGRRRRVTR